MQSIAILTAASWPFYPGHCTCIDSRTIHTSRGRDDSCVWTACAARTDAPQLGTLSCMLHIAREDYYIYHPIAILRIHTYIYLFAVAFEAILPSLFRLRWTLLRIVSRQA